METAPAQYGLWSVAILNSAIFILFAFSFTEADVPEKGIFAGDALPRLAGICDPIVTAKTVAHSTNRIDVAPLLAEAAARLSVG